MAQEITIPQDFGLPSQIGNDMEDDNLAAGMRPSFGVLAFPGKVWTLRYKKQDLKLLDGEGNARPQVEIVVVKTCETLSRKYYIKGFDPNAKTPPDCWSTDGKLPDKTVMSPISPSCATCEMGKIGSRMTDQGKPSKACGDFRRVAIVPFADIQNEAFGGPMLLQIPAASLQNYVEYGEQLKQMGFKTFTVGTRLKFDIDENYPKIVFSPYKALNDRQVQQILELRADERTARILNEELHVIDPDATAETAEEAPPPKPQVRPAAAVQPKPAPATAASKPAPATPKAAPVAAATAAPKPAPAKAAPTQMTAGGFGVGTPAAAGVARPNGGAAPTTVKAAVARPAPRPASVRPVQTQAFAAPAEEAEQETTGEATEETAEVAAEEENLGEPLNVSVPEGMDDELEKLLGHR